MKYRLSEWAEKEYSPESKPCSDTLRKWAKNGRIKGAYLDESGRWWVDCHEKRVEKRVIDDTVLRMIS